mmetsp:Transcript_44417/g.137077  ORF Transcript_44417/g.137077 Transcript_44417/m.137077 type:complete len:294 (+) Transcript_44417:278-1159(+)
MPQRCAAQLQQPPGRWKALEEQAKRATSQVERTIVQRTTTPPPIPSRRAPRHRPRLRPRPCRRRSLVRAALPRSRKATSFCPSRPTYGPSCRPPTARQRHPAPPRPLRTSPLRRRRPPRGPRTAVRSAAIRRRQAHRPARRARRRLRTRSPQRAAVRRRRQTSCPVTRPPLRRRRRSRRSGLCFTAVRRSCGQRTPRPSRYLSCPSPRRPRHPATPSALRPFRCRRRPHRAQGPRRVRGRGRASGPSARFSSSRSSLAPAAPPPPRSRRTETGASRRARTTAAVPRHSARRGG